MPEPFKYASNCHIKQDTELLLKKLDTILELFKDLKEPKDIELQTLKGCENCFKEDCDNNCIE